MTRKEAEDRIREKLLDVQAIMRQVDGGNMTPLYVTVTGEYVWGFQYGTTGARTLDVWKGATNDIQA